MGFAQVVGRVPFRKPPLHLVPLGRITFMQLGLGGVKFERGGTLIHKRRVGRPVATPYGACIDIARVATWSLDTAVLIPVSIFPSLTGGDA